MLTVDFHRIPVQPGWRILDIGCGSGRHLAEAARYRDVCIAGTDLHPAELKQAGDRLDWLAEMGECRGRCILSAADITRLPFADESFDLVICSEVLEHIPDHARAVAETVRVLKPGSPLVVSVPRYLPERICWLLSSDYRNTPGGHIRIYRRRELTDLLSCSGVRPGMFRWAHSLHTPYWWLKCLLGPQREDRWPVRLYHRFLVWDMMNHPRLIRFLERLLDPVLGKSLVVYLTRPPKGERL